MSLLPTTANRTAALTATTRKPATVLELSIDKCANAFGVSPCIAGRLQSAQTAQAATANTLTLSATASAVNDAYKGALVNITGGSGAVQQRNVLTSRTNLQSYSNSLATTPWAGAATIAQNVTGYDGSANSAWTLTNNYVSYAGLIAVLGQTSTRSFFVKKTTGVQPSYSVFSVEFTGNKIGLITLDPTNGIATVWTAYTGWTIVPVTARCTSYNANYWLVEMVFTAPVAGGFNSVIYVGSAGTNATQSSGVITVVGTGTIVVQQFQYESGNSASARIVTLANPAVGVVVDVPWTTLPDSTSVYDLIDRPNACYNTYGTCQTKPNYALTSSVIRFVTRGVQSPLTETLRPYLLASNSAPVMLDMEAGLAARSAVTVQLADETDNDSDQDPYYATRAAPATGTYWTRFFARNKNYFGRHAKLRRGFVASPWDWTLFLDELYIIDSAELDAQGQVKLTLKDPLKFVDNNLFPLASSGTCQGVLKAIENSAQAVAGAASTITLAASAAATDGYYTGMEVYVYANTGAGQRRVVASYVGATRVATLTAAWAVIPDATSSYQISGLSVTVEAGLGVQYNNPATSGKPEYIRIGSEIIQYTTKTADTLSWPDATYRGAFGSVVGDHKINDGVQLCRAFINQTVQQVITALITENGIAAGYIGGSLAADCALWYTSAWNINACISAPSKPSALLADLLKQIGAVLWWSPQTQTLEFKALIPAVSTYPTWADDANLMQGGTTIKNLDTLRITQASIAYALKDATANLSQPINFMRTNVYVDAAAQSALEYNDIRPLSMFSRWFTQANAVAMAAAVSRLTSRLRDVPKLFAVKIDPKDYTLAIGSLVAIKSARNTDARGAAKSEVCMITQSLDMSTHIEVLARTLNFNFRYAFIAPPGTPDYSTDTLSAHIANPGGLMANGDLGYTII